MDRELLGHLEEQRFEGEEEESEDEALDFFLHLDLAEKRLEEKRAAAAALAGRKESTKRRRTTASPGPGARLRLSKDGLPPGWQVLTKHKAKTMKPFPPCRPAKRGDNTHALWIIWEFLFCFGIKQSFCLELELELFELGLQLTHPLQLHFLHEGLILPAWLVHG